MNSDVREWCCVYEVMTMCWHHEGRWWSSYSRDYDESKSCWLSCHLVIMIIASTEKEVFRSDRVPLWSSHSSPWWTMVCFICDVNTAGGISVTLNHLNISWYNVMSSPPPPSSSSLSVSSPHILLPQVIIIIISTVVMLLILNGNTTREYYCSSDPQILITCMIILELIIWLQICMLQFE